MGAFQIIASVTIGVLLAWFASQAIIYALEPPEIRNYEAGRPVFDHPVPESYAKLVGQQLRKKIRADAILARTPWPDRLALTLVVFLTDPINLLLTALFSWFGYFLVSRLQDAWAKPVS